MTLGNSFVKSQPDSAVELTLKAKEFASAHALSSQLTELRLTLANAYMNQGQFALSDIELHSRIAELEAFGNTGAVISTIQHLGNSLLRRGKYTEAKAEYNRAIKMASEHQLIGKWGTLFTNLGRLERQAGNLDLAEEYFLKAGEIFKKAGDLKQLGTSYVSICLALVDLGKSDEALEYGKNAIALLTAYGTPNDVAFAQNNVASIYGQQGNYHAALKLYARCETVWRASHDDRNLASVMINIAGMNHWLGNYVLAGNYYDSSYQIGSRLRLKDVMATALLNRGENRKFLNQFEAARSDMGLALQLFQETGFQTGIANSYQFLAQLELDDGNFEKALGYCDKAMKVANLSGFNDIMRDALKVRAVSLLKQNEEVLASKCLDSLMLIRNKDIQQNFTIQSESERELYLKLLTEDYELYFDFCLHSRERQNGTAGKLYNLTLQLKGLLLKSVNAMKQAIRNSGDSLLLNDYEQWIGLRQKTARNMSNGPELDSLAEKANELEQTLAVRSAAFKSFENLGKNDWKVVRSHLRSNEAAIELIKFQHKDPNEYFAFRITNTATVIYAALVVMPNSTEPKMIRLFEEKALQELLDKYQGTNFRAISGLYGNNDSLNTELYQLIWKPMEIELKNIDKVYLSTIGLLNKISFAALAPSFSRSLSGELEIQMCSSTAMLNNSPEPKRGAINSMLLMGGIDFGRPEGMDDDKTKTVWPFLEGSQNEVEKIAINEDISFDINLRTGTEATEEEFKTSATKSTFIHIATHGFAFPDPVSTLAFFDQDTIENLNFRSGPRSINDEYYGLTFVNNSNPLLRTGLIFADANKSWIANPDCSFEKSEDGILTAQEVSNLDLSNVELVVLSACETGLGDIKGFEGVYGLQRAFKMAGVRYIMMSLWQVPDKETAEFMTTFYKNLIRLSDIRKAFSLTQRTMRRKYDPYYWAAFVLVE